MEEKRQDHSEWLALATLGCSHCGGCGLDDGEMCQCVLRRICRCVVAKVHELEAVIGNIHGIPLDVTSVPQGYRQRGLRAVEYIADVYNVARRALPDPAAFFTFKHHIIGKREASWCWARLGIAKHTFWYRTYAIEAKLGRVFLELKPYPLFPTNRYFDTRLEKVQPCAVRPMRYENGVPLRAPLRVPERVAMPSGPMLVVIPAPPVPPKPVLSMDAASAVAFMRKNFRAGRGLYRIARDLCSLAPAPNGDRWRPCDVRRALLEHPRPKREYRRTAPEPIGAPEPEQLGPWAWEKVA